MWRKFRALLIALVVSSILEGLLKTIIVLPSDTTWVIGGWVNGILEMPSDIVLWGTIFWVFYDIDVLGRIRNDFK